MKSYFFALLFFYFSDSSAQSFMGTWLGTVRGSTGSLNAEMSLISNENKTQLSGNLRVENAGLLDNYEVEAKVNGNVAKGTLKYKDGTVFPFEMSNIGGVLTQNVFFNNQLILEGTYKAGSLKQANEIAKNDGLYRDPKLIGSWVHHENYSSNGGFYGGSSSTIELFADGRIGDGGSSNYISGPNSSGNSGGGGNSAVDQVSASGARWFTKGNMFYWRVKVNGQIKDVANSKYYLEKGALLLTDLQSGKKKLYYKK